MLNNQRTKAGFTLIELLVVIAIIAILASVLFPVFLTVREKGRQQKCLQNLKQLTIAMVMYSNDFNNNSPNPSWVAWPKDWEGMQWWRGKIVPRKGQIWYYTRNLQMYECPSDATVTAEDVINYSSVNSEMWLIAKSHYGLSYSMNSDFNIGGCRTLKIDSIRRTKEVMMLIHESRKTINDGGYNWHTYDAPSPTHADGTTIGYADCHARWRSVTMINKDKQTGVWNPLR